MGKQPYIPLYVGDYLKDTRVLPLAVRGAWVDLILFMWDSPVRGELVGSIEDFARLMSCEKSEAKFALDLLKQKNIADFDLLANGEIKITSRKMKRDADISKIRSDVGKKGVMVKKQKEFASAKQKQNTEYDNEYEFDNDNCITYGNKGELRISVKKVYAGDKMKVIYDLREYFKPQLDQFSRSGWTKFIDFMRDNPGRVFDDDNHVYNAFKQFHLNGKKEVKNRGKIQ